MSQPVFVYGNLRSGQNRAAALDRFQPQRKPAVLPGALLYSFGSYPGLALSDDLADHVTGELCWLEPNAEALAYLDEIEGATSGDYRRVTVAALADEHSIIAWAYVLHNEQPRPDSRIPGGDWVM